jgi:hypothetical protein
MSKTVDEGSVSDTCQVNPRWQHQANTHSGRGLALQKLKTLLFAGMAGKIDTLHASAVPIPVIKADHNLRNLMLALIGALHFEVLSVPRSTLSLWRGEVGSPAQGAVSRSFQTTRSTSGPVTHNESLIPLTPAGYPYCVLASLPKSKIDRLTPRLLQASSSRESAEVPGGDKNASANVGCKYASEH